MLNLTQSISTIHGQFATTRTVTADGEVYKNPSLPAAKIGALTTRTSDSVGTLTMNTGHGISTGNRLDLYWLDPTTGLAKSRYGITVGTVAVDSVPITSGAGDVLPLDETAITAMVPQLEALPVVTASMQSLVVACPYPANAIIRDVTPVVLAPIFIEGSTDTYVWDSANGIANPLADDAVDVYLSHGYSGSAATVLVSALVN